MAGLINKPEHFIQSAIKKPGQLHRDLRVKQGEKIPAAKLAAAAKQPGKVGERARFAENIRWLPHPHKNLGHYLHPKKAK